ncbi:AAA family ATPase [Ramlibacter pallidus]|uniref:ATP-binding protein n=1 Tax=Ramlibacter pallidus TaxID=2780087 RepID=A0ABR9S734_9BURK|nr:ATP-binding protein [Ramlibacter pallidus]MBE7369311.1 ATP-binding protein [Ramlibacter pallidus]
MASIHLVEGPVGAGKSTFAARLAAGRAAPHLNLDAWFVALFSPDRPAAGVMPWYAERKWRCIEQLWSLGCDLVRCGSDAVLELGLLTRADRERVYARAEAAGIPLVLHVLEADREVRRARVRQRNLERGPTFSMEVPDAIFDLASDRWEAPDAGECEGRDVRFVRTDAGQAL